MLYTVLSFPKGKLFLAKKNHSLCLAHYMQKPEEIGRTLDWLTKIGFTPQADDHGLKFERDLFNRYFQGDRVSFRDLPLDFVSGTPYQQQVWRKAAEIPYGQTETYKTIALSLGSQGFQSAGQALSKNPILIAVPCHRVLATGGLGGFSAGLELKKYLLDLEGCPYPS